MAGSFELIDSLDQASTMDVDLPSGGVDKGEVLQVGSTYGFTLADVDDSGNAYDIDPQQYTLVYKARKVRANKDNETISQGAFVYWDGTSITGDSSGSQPIVGVCIKDATAADTTVDIDFDGTISTFD